MHNKPVSLRCDAMPSSVQFLGQHFGDKLLVTKGRMTHGDLEGCLGVVLFELAIFGFEVHVLRALGDCDEKNPYSVFNLSISISGATEGSVIVSCPSVQIPRPGPKRHVALLVPQVHSPTCSTAGHKEEKQGRNKFHTVASERKKQKFRPANIPIALVRQLIDGYSPRKRKGRPASFQAKKCVVLDDVHLARVENYAKNSFQL
ncbi:hypothetical protein TNCV_1397251 [Trichonephila clavipes]|nr:hypothetical protein TNCV_1397251 [Trichonephila clavipes]